MDKNIHIEINEWMDGLYLYDKQPGIKIIMLRYSMHKDKFSAHNGAHIPLISRMQKY